MFNSLAAAAHGLLLSVSRSLTAQKVDFIVVGGWVPVIRGGAEALCHPGTRDVDILLIGTVESAQDAFRALLGNGYFASAKHEFQLLCPINVSGTNFIFNVDFLHPTDGLKNPDMFQDIIDLQVSDMADGSGRRWGKSIAFTDGSAVIRHSMWNAVDISGEDTQSDPATTSLPLLTYDGFVLSKLKSVRQIKRPRDAFDLFYISQASDAEATRSAITSVCDTDPGVASLVEDFRSWLEEKSALVDHNVRKYAELAPSVSPSEEIRWLVGGSDGPSRQAVTEIRRS